MGTQCHTVSHSVTQCHTVSHSGRCDCLYHGETGARVWKTQSCPSATSHQSSVTSHQSPVTSHHDSILCPPLPLSYILSRQAPGLYTSSPISPCPDRLCASPRL